MLGLEGSGKTTFIFAVVKAFIKFGKDLGWHCEYSPMSKTIEQGIADFVSIGKLPHKTKEITVFEIRLKLTGPFSERNYEHRLEIMDIPENVLLSDQLHKDVQQYVKYVDGVLLFKEIIQSSNTSDIAPLYKFMSRNISTDHMKHEPFVAVCFPKVDKYISNFISLSDIFSKTKFSGWDDFTLLKSRDFLGYFATIFDRKHSNLYASSSVGWVKSSNGNHFPNITAITGSADKYIYKLEDWRPNNILEPLMWLIDNIEFMALDKNLRDPLYSQQLINYWEWFEIKQKLPNYEIGYIEWQKTR